MGQFVTLKKSGPKYGLHPAFFHILDPFFKVPDLKKVAG
jgi:hypothetical protein